MQDDVPNLLARERPTWLTGHDHRNATRPERICEFLDLRTLTSAVQTFKCYEFSAVRLGHENDDTACRFLLSAFSLQLPSFVRARAAIHHHEGTNV